MRRLTRLLGLILGMLLMLPLPGRAETGSFRVTVNGVTHTITYQAFIDQHVSDLRDPERFRFHEGVSLSLEVFDGTLPRIIEKVSVEVPPTPRLPQGAELDVPESFSEPGFTDLDFFLNTASPLADMGTFEFAIKLTTGDKIRIAPFPITLHRLPDLQNVQFLDDTTKPVITWASVPGAQRYKVKIRDPETGLTLFQTKNFPAAPGDVQTVDLKAPGFPDPWTGMELGKRYVIRIEARLLGPNPIPEGITLPFSKKARVPAPPAGQGQITRSMRWVEYTPLVLAP